MRFNNTNNKEVSTELRSATRWLVCSIVLLLNVPVAFAQTKWNIIKEQLIFKDAPFKQCHASTVVEVRPGKLLMACFGGSHEGASDVCVWLSEISDGKISLPLKVADGFVNDTLRYPVWNPVLFKSKKGTLFLFYKVGPNPREWWGMVKTSDDLGKNWSVARKLPPKILGPIKNKPVQLSDGTILSPSSVEETSGKWKATVEVSKDNGKNWMLRSIDTTSLFDVIQPTILCYSKTRLQMLCRSKQGAVVQTWSYNNGKTWGDLSKTMLPNPNSGIDAVTLKNKEQIIVYNPDIPGKEWYNGRGKLRVASSVDGITWSDIAILENDDNKEFSYPAIIQTEDGSIHITYTYNRANIKHVILKRS